MSRKRKNKIDINKKTYEECLPEILQVIQSRKFRWQLSSIPSISWEDVVQIILTHIYRKWHLFDPNKAPLKTWVLVVTSNQMINLARNIYGNYKKICLSCVFYEGENLCKKFGSCDSSKCDLLRSWEKKRKPKFDINLPLPIENHMNEVHEITQDNLDIEKTAVNLHIEMKKNLKPLEWIVYKGLFIDHLSDEVVAKKLGLKSTEKNRTPGYGRLSQLKKIILIKVKEVLRKGDVEMVGDNNI